MKSTQMSIHCKFSRKSFLTLRALDPLDFPWSMSSLLVSFKIRISFECGTATGTTDACQAS